MNRKNIKSSNFQTRRFTIGWFLHGAAFIENSIFEGDYKMKLEKKARNPETILDLVPVCADKKRVLNRIREALEQ